ncbi:MAG: DUF6636 domain-containing protein [Lapillicoccus sp.]
MRIPAARAHAGLAAPAAALIALAVLTSLAGCGGGGGGSTGTTTVTVTPTVTSSPPSPTATETPKLTPPQSYGEALQHLSTGVADAAATKTFTSPTGNIYCDIYAGSAIRGCELRSGRIAPPTPAYCAGAGGGAKDIGRVQFTAAGPVAQCNTDAISKDGAPVLKYGSTATAGSIACVSESIGMTCVDSSSQKGFFLARDTFFIF